MKTIGTRQLAQYPYGKAARNSRKMINEPGYWKRDLERMATQLDRRRSQRVWRRESYAALEKLIILAFYSTRKLIEGEWIDRRLRSEQVELVTFPSLRKRMLRTSWPAVDEHFDLNSPQKRKQPLEFICNQIVHSFVLTPSFRGGRLSGIYFCSYERKERVWLARIEELVRVLRKAAASRHAIMFRSCPEENRYDE